MKPYLDSEHAASIGHRPDFDGGICRASEGNILKDKLENSLQLQSDKNSQVKESNLIMEWLGLTRKHKLVYALFL